MVSREWELALSCSVGITQAISVNISGCTVAPIISAIALRTLPSGELSGCCSQWPIGSSACHSLT
ncbi:MAG: hypothetical protein H8E62_01035 [Planctomycetes bacterium]|nr:hypothetical protein [Planctomycetota bacterium]